jgi:hypothetical protein
MSDVEAGGATVFPQINLSLWPQKGSAAFWFNLHPNGEGDDLTQHAACPVLTGSKWGKIFKMKRINKIQIDFLWKINFSVQQMDS